MLKYAKGPFTLTISYFVSVLEPTRSLHGEPDQGAALSLSPALWGDRGGGSMPIPNKKRAANYRSEAVLSDNGRDALRREARGIKENAEIRHTHQSMRFHRVNGRGGLEYVPGSVGRQTPPRHD